MPSIVPHYLMPRVRDTVAAEAFHWSLPLEDVADPGRPQPPLRPLAAVHPDIAEFMRRPQLGARRVAKIMLEAAHSIRMGQFSAALSEGADAIDDAVFTHLPSDRGHFGVPYLAHVLGGLRHRPPTYVQDLLAGRTPPTWTTDAVAGIVVIRDPEPAIHHLAAPAEHGRMPTERHLAVVHSDDRECDRGLAELRMMAAKAGGVRALSGDLAPPGATRAVSELSGKPALPSSITVAARSKAASSGVV